jgi:hypothetical protein
LVSIPAHYAREWRSCKSNGAALLRRLRFKNV